MEAEKRELKKLKENWRALSIDQLLDELIEMKKGVFLVRYNQFNRRSLDNQMLKKFRKRVAIINTIITEKSLKNEA